MRWNILPCFELIFIYFSFFIQLEAQYLPMERITDWNRPGCLYTFKPTETYFLADYGADTTGLTSVNAAIEKILSLSNKPIKIIFPKGKYLLDQILVLRDSIIIEGETDSTHNLSQLLLNTGENRPGILIQGKMSLGLDSIFENISQGINYIVVKNFDKYRINDFVQIYPMHDDALINNDWAKHQTGQIMQIKKIIGDTLYFTKPIRRAYSITEGIIINRINPIQQVHINCVDIIRKDSTISQTSNVLFRMAANCSVEGIHSLNCNYAHIDLVQTTQVSIKNSYFENAFGYGGGGRAYGIMIESCSGDNFIHQNYFYHLRHSMILQAGANGNVVAFNYSTNPFWTETVLPSNASGDIVLHGNYNYLNLFEGNIIQNIVIDNSHGINGPFNTFYRNRAELYGIFMNTSPASNSQNFIANQVTNTSNLFYGLYSLQGANHFEYGNMVRGKVIPTNTVEPNDSSLFNYDFPSFYYSIGKIPAIQSKDWNLNLFANEVSYRVNRLHHNSICTDWLYTKNTGISFPKYTNTNDIEIQPNPFQNDILIKNFTGFEIQKIELLDLNSNLIQTYTEIQSTTECSLRIKSEMPGMYFLAISITNGDKLMKKLIKL